MTAKAVNEAPLPERLLHWPARPYNHNPSHLIYFPSPRNDPPEPQSLCVLV